MNKTQIREIPISEDIINTLKSQYYSGELSSFSFDNVEVDMRINNQYRHTHVIDYTDKRLSEMGDDRLRHTTEYPG